jgi:hypothetical protein
MWPAGISVREGMNYTNLLMNCVTIQNGDQLIFTWFVYYILKAYIKI